MSLKRLLERQFESGVLKTLSDFRRTAELRQNPVVGTTWKPQLNLELEPSEIPNLGTSQDVYLDKPGPSDQDPESFSGYSLVIDGISVSVSQNNLGFPDKSSRVFHTRTYPELASGERKKPNFSLYSVLFLHDSYEESAEVLNRRISEGISLNRKGKMYSILDFKDNDVLTTLRLEKI